MSYLALYRKLRPRVFNDVIGQTHITKTLKNQIINNRMSHAYLFCGTRGTGKTSTAKIFSQAINCLEPIEGEPCLKCKMCTDIMENRSLNVLEIDAASNNGVDNIREIREEIKYMPAEGTYKVYIIDEVHMLSTAAFNALLKTLEEPPKHVVFILATTESQKIPATILSRCQRFDFKRITVTEMSKNIRIFVDNEQIKINNNAISYLSHLADGSMRDALSILDQAAAFYYNEEITVEKIMDIIGSVDRQIFYDLSTALSEFDSIKCIDIINKIILTGRDITQFISELILFFRNLLVAKSATQNLDSFDISIENLEKLKEFATGFSVDTLLYYINVFSNLVNNLKFDQNPRVSIEVCCIKLCNPQTDSKNTNLEDRLRKLESAITSGEFISTPKKIDEPKIEKPIIKVQKPAPEDIQNVIDNKELFANSLDTASKAMYNNATLTYLDDNKVTLTCNDAGTCGFFKNRIDYLKEVLKKIFDKDFEINVIHEVENNISKEEPTTQKDPNYEHLQDSFDMEVEIK